MVTFREGNRIKLKLFFEHLSDIDTLEAFYHNILLRYDQKLTDFSKMIADRYSEVIGMRIEKVRMVSENLDGYLFLYNDIVDFVSEQKATIVSLDLKRILEKVGTRKIIYRAGGVGVEIDNYIFAIHDNATRELFIHFLDSFNDNIDRQLQDDSKDFAEEVTVISNNILKEKQGNRYDLYRGFISKYLTEIFLSLRGVQVFESHLVRYYGEIGVQTLIFQENHVSISNIKFTPVIENFNKLVTLVVNKQYYKDHKIAAYVSWVVLREMAIDYYYHSFLIENPHFKELSLQKKLSSKVSFFISQDYFLVESETNIVHFIYFLMVDGTLNRDLSKLEEYYHMIRNEIKHIKQELEVFESTLLKPNVTDKITIDDIDLMTGQEFEDFVAILFNKKGYKTTVTKTSGDQGIDVIAEKKGIRIGIQAKCYSNHVPNKAIQEVVAGLRHYNLNKGIVITNNFFTNSAFDLAYSNNIILWDRTMLIEKLQLINKEQNEVKG